MRGMVFVCFSVDFALLLPLLSTTFSRSSSFRSWRLFWSALNCCSSSSLFWEENMTELHCTYCSSQFRSTSFILTFRALNAGSMRTFSILNSATSPSCSSDNICCAVPMSRTLEDGRISPWSSASRGDKGASSVEVASVAFWKEGISISPRLRDVFLYRIAPGSRFCALRIRPPLSVVLSYGLWNWGLRRSSSRTCLIPSGDIFHVHRRYGSLVYGAGRKWLRGLRIIFD